MTTVSILPHPTTLYLLVYVIQSSELVFEVGRPFITYRLFLVSQINLGLYFLSLFLLWGSLGVVPYGNLFIHTLICTPVAIVVYILL